MTNCAFTSNTSISSSGGGGGIFNQNLRQRHTHVINCTFTGNTAYNVGGGIDNYLAGSSACVLTNDIFYGDTSYYSGEISRDPGSPSVATATFCDVAGGYAGTGNINADPLFAASSVNLHLKAGSPCLAAGTAANAPATTLDGRARPAPPSIGAYELGITRAVPAQYTTIQAAVNASGSGDIVLLADGTYTGLGNRDVDFGGRNVTVTSQHGPASTIINCGGAASPNGSGDHRGFYIHSGETSAVISDLTIENGYESNGAGGGIDNENSSLTALDCVLTNNLASVGGGIAIESGGTGEVTGCTFSGNTASSGGGLENENLSASKNASTVTNCVFTGNSAFVGGGIDNLASGGPITVTGCTFTGNTASGNGGGLYNFTNSGAITVTGCTLSGNSASPDPAVDPNDGVGGGLYNDNEGSDTLLVTNCALTQNTAYNIGGGVFNTGSGPLLLTNCLLGGNTAYYGGGIGIDSAGPISVTDCTLTGNSAHPGSGGGIYAFLFGTLTLTDDILYGDTGGEILKDPGSSASPVVTFCDVQGGYAGTGNINADPRFVNAPADLHLQAGSPCTGKGTPVSGVSTDLDGHFRPNSPTIGAYEGSLFETTTALASSLNPSAVGQSVTFTATVMATSGSNTPTGTVQFAVGYVNVGSPVVLTSSGRVTYSASSLTVGAHAITAVYTPTGAFASSANTLTQTVNAATAASHLHVLWHNTQDGRTALWTVSATGVVTGTAYPNAPGWTAKALADGPDGLAHVLWNNTNGTIALWTVAANGTPAYATFGPYAGLTANALAVGPDNHTHVLWNYQNGAIALWDMAPGAAPTGVAYGPFAGYSAKALAVGPDNHVHVLWNVQGGGIALWDIAPGASPVGTAYSIPSAYTALALSAGPDNHVHVLWNHAPDSQIALWDIAPGAAPLGAAFGPYSGYSASSLAVGPDNHTHVLWNVGSGGNTVWDIAPGLAPAGVFYNPGSGWAAVAVSAQP